MRLDPERFERTRPPRVIMEGGNWTQAATPEECMNIPDYYARRIVELDAQVAMRESGKSHFRRINTVN